MRWGIYPGGPLGTSDGTMLGDGPEGRPDDPVAALAAIDELRSGRPFHVRGYASYTDDRDRAGLGTEAPVDLRAYTATGCRADLVLQFHSASGDVAGFARFVREMVTAFADVLDAVQIGEEANITDNPMLDGYYPCVLDAIAAGVVEARRTLDELGAEAIVGTNSAVLLDDPDYYRRLVWVGGAPFVDALDWIGLDAFPDVFRPFPPGADPAAVCTWLLGEHRRRAYAPAGLDHLPLHVTEHGWPTGPDRPLARQALLLRAMTDAVARPELRVASYTHFSLRDATDDGSFFGGFGITDLDYRPKEAFGVYADAVSPG